MTTRPLPPEARRALRITTHLMNFKFRPETTVKSPSKSLTMERCLSWDKEMPISSAHALTHARLEFSSMVLNMCNKGSMAITNKDPDKGHPCKTPNKMTNIRIIPLGELI